MTELQPLKFTDSVNNIEFRLQGDNAPQEIIRLDSKGFHYRGQVIEDAGEAHQLMVKFLKQSTQSQPEPVAPTDEEIGEWHDQCADLTRLGEVDHYWAFDLRHDEVTGVVRAALARWGTPAIQPVPVSERLPDPEECDAEGGCWWWHPGHKEDDFIDGWILLNPKWAGSRRDSDDSLIYTHWLPANVLPTPEA